MKVTVVAGRGAVIKALLLAFVLLVSSLCGHDNVAAQQSTTKAGQVQVRNVLFIGNSRLYVGDIPKLFTEIAKSAKLPTRYETVLHGVPNAWLDDHLRSSDLAKLLAGKWDIVIIQPAGGENVDAPDRENFQKNGAALIERAGKNAGQVMMLATWPYSDEGYAEMLGSLAKNRTMLQNLRAEHIKQINEDFKALTDKTGAAQLNLTAPWMRLRERAPALPLYEDATHATPAGSYFAALVIFAALEKGAVEKVTYVPKGITEADAKLMREVAAQGNGG